jgi:predicted amidophosphoribosyltransferase
MITTITCPSCKKETPSDMSICGYCGFRLKMKKRKAPKPGIVEEVGVGIIKDVVKNKIQSYLDKKMEVDDYPFSFSGILWTVYDAFTSFLARQNFFVRLIIIFFSALFLTSIVNAILPVSDFEKLNGAKESGRNVGQFFVWLTLITVAYKMRNLPKQVEEEIESEKDETVCGSCGQDIRESDKFCKNCGSPEKTSKFLYSISPTKEGREEYLKKQALKQEHDKILEEQLQSQQKEEETKKAIRREYHNCRQKLICEGCSAGYVDDRKFCSECGGKVVKRRLDNIFAELKEKYPELINSEADLRKIIGKKALKPADNSFPIEEIVRKNYPVPLDYKKNAFISFYDKIRPMAYCPSCCLMVSESGKCRNCDGKTQFLNDEQAFLIGNTVFQNHFESFSDFKPILEESIKASSKQVLFGIWLTILILFAMAFLLVSC